MDTTKNRPITADEFLVYPEGGPRDELVRGEIEMNPQPASRHGLVATNMILRLGAYVHAHELGMTFDPIGYELPNVLHTVRGPDVSFVRADRLPAEGVGEGFLKLAPDLAVEILSPSNRAGKIKQKADDYLIAGVRLIWVIDPAKRIVTVTRPNHAPITLDESQTLDGGDVVPGFACAVAELFRGAAR